MNYTTKQLTPASYSHIVDLLHKSFGLKRKKSDIINKYSTENFGKPTIGFFALNETGEYVAYYGVFPLILDYFNQDILVAQSGETMTIPEHRNKGLFTMLAKETYKKTNEEGIKLVFGFPNENSAPGFIKKLNWKFIGKMKKGSIHVSTLPFLELSHKFNSLKLLYLKYSNAKLKKYKLSLSNENVIDFNFGENPKVKKDIVFIEYKLLSDENHLVEIEGFKMLIKLEGHLKIGLVGYFEQEKTNDFINVCKKLAKKIGSSKVIFLMSENYWLFEYLKSDVNIEDSLPIGLYFNDETFNFSNIEFVQADFDTF